MTPAKHVKLCTLVALLHLAILGVSGLYLCPPPTTTLGTFGPCMPWLEGYASDPNPDADCCYVVRTTEPSCLCTTFMGYKNSPAISEKVALSLPKLCGRIVPVNFTCHGEPVPSAPIPPKKKPRRLQQLQ